MNRDTSLRAAAAITLFLLVINIGLALRNTRELQINTGWVEHTHQVIGRLEAALAEVTEAESGVRGYLISGDEAHLAQVEPSLAKIANNIDQVEALTKDSSRQQALIPDLRRRMDARVVILRKLVELRRANSLDAVREAMAGYRGKDEMDALRAVATDMISFEQANLRERSQQAEQTYRVALVASISSGLLGLFAIIGGFWLVRRHLRERELAEATVSQQAERLRTTLASIGDGVITTDKTGLVTNMNAVAEHLTGWTTDQALGKPLADVFTIVNESTREPVSNPAMRALSEGTIVGLANHTVLIAKDGTERPIDDSAAPIRSEKGDIVGCVLVFHDVSERRESEKTLERSERDLRDLFDNATIGIHWVGPDGTILRANRNELDLLGYSEEEFVGHNIAEFHADEDVISEILRALTAGESLTEQSARLVCKDGSIKKVSINSNTFREGDEFIHSRCFTRDVTEFEKAQAAQAHLAAIVETSQDAVISKKLDGTITTWNAGAVHLFGYLPEDAIGQHVSILIPHDRLDEEKLIISRLIKGERIENYDTVRLRKDGSPVDVSLTISPIRDVKGNIVGASKFVRDITERKVSEQSLRVSEQRLRQLADAMPQIVWGARPDGVLDYYNGRWFLYIDVPLDDIEAAQWDRFIHPDDLQRAYKRWTESISTGEPYEIEFRIRRADGEYRWFLARALPVLDENDEITRWFGTCTDIHVEKQVANELRVVAANLSEADRRKNEFLAMLAHELRNPLAPIRNALQIIRLTGPGEVAPATDMMERQVNQLVRLVDDLLDISRINSGKIELRKGKIELASFVNHAVEAARPSCESGGVELRVSLPANPIYLNGDPIRLAQVVGNLLNNACKFTDRGGAIDLIVERDGNDATIVVRDDGIGIDPDEIKYIFEMFVQADTSLKRSSSGLGIGLTLVKNLVEMHGGSVSASSPGLGKGTAFTIRLPILAEESVSTTRVEKLEGGSTLPSRRILVVDDNVDSASSLEMLLKIYGHDVRMAHDGLEAVESAESFLPHVILLDIGLPKLNGYEAARQIRQSPWGRDIVLIALTGWGQEEDRQRSTEAGFDRHMVKPIEHDDLMKLLEELVP